MAKKKQNYVDPIILAKELIQFSKTGDITPELGEMFLEIALNVSNRKNFINYTYKDDMIGRGVLFLCKYAKGYDSNNPKANAFSYVTRICSNGFVQCIKDEKKKSKLKDDIISLEKEKDENCEWYDNKDMIDYE